jgi:hypothetical protein
MLPEIRGRFNAAPYFYITFVFGKIVEGLRIMEENSEKTLPPKKTLLEKGIAFISEEAKWLAHRRPYRTISEVNYIYYNICKPCEYFENDGCRVCGCRIVANERTPLNKLSMATTNCPLPEPKWVSTITPPTEMTAEQVEQLTAAIKASNPKKTHKSCCH